MFRLTRGRSWESSLNGISDESLVSALCERNHISEAQFYAWRDKSLAGATLALTDDDSPVNNGRSLETRAGSAVRS